MPFEKLNSLWMVLGISFGYFSVKHEEFGLAIRVFADWSLWGDVTLEFLCVSTNSYGVAYFILGK